MKTLKFILVALILGFTIHLCFRNYKLSKAVDLLKARDSSHIVDTVYLEKPFTPQGKFSEDHLPKKILVYGKKDSLKSIFPSVMQDSSTISQDSLVQFIIKRNQLDISLFNKSTQTYFTKQFEIDLDKYQYNWLNGLFSKRSIILPRVLFKPYIYGKYRPFHFLWDIGSGISIETKRFNYRLGINAFYYPKLKSGMGTDIEFKVEYKF